MDAAQPSIAGRLEFPGGHLSSLALSGSLAFATDIAYGLRVIDLQNPAQPVQVGAYTPLGYAQGISVAGDYAYVAADSSGLRIVDISTPGQPVEVGALQLNSSAMNVLAAGNYAYLCGMSFYIADVSDPRNPLLLSQYRVDGACRELDYRDGMVVLATESGLDFIDVRNPKNPVRITELKLQSSSTEDTVVGVLLNGDFAYTGSSYTGVEVFDLSNLPAVQPAGAFNNGKNFTQDLFIQENLAYLADFFGLQILDVSDPHQPAGLGFYDTPDEVYAVTSAGSAVFISDGRAGVYVVDTSNPAAPFLLEVIDTPGFVHEASISEGNLYVADGANGLVVYAQNSEPENQDQARVNTQRLPNSRLENTVLASLYEPGNPIGDLPHRMLEAPTGEINPAPVDTGIYSQACTVSSVADSGSGSLRSCLQNASHLLVTFDLTVFPPDAPASIYVRNTLPLLDQGNVMIDASNAGVILDGSQAPPGTNGIVIQSDGNILQGLQIVHFPGQGIFLQVGSQNRIGGNRFNGAGPMGQGNLVSANGGTGINIHGERTFANTVQGNFIGVDLKGTTALGNAGTGISLAGRCHQNIIGGGNPGEGNLVSGNGSTGISFMAYANNNLVIGNFVGTDLSGSLDLGNNGHGIGIEVGSFNNRIEGNLSSGNVLYGLLVDAGWYNTLVGNWVGVDATGTQAIPNDSSGIFVGFGRASYNRIGGTHPGEGNLVSGNPSGIQAGGGGADPNLVLGNWVGVDSSGIHPLGNAFEGILLSPGGRVIVGGASPAERNVIGGNAWQNGFPGGVLLACDDCLVSGNYIGVGADGVTAVANIRTGIYVQNAQRSLVQANLVSRNRDTGIFIEMSQAITLRRNLIFQNEKHAILPGENTSDIRGPVFQSVDTAHASGSVCPGCTVELFYSDDLKGLLYLGTAIAAEDGSWSLAFSEVETGKSLYATATDPAGNTSDVFLTACSGKGKSSHRSNTHSPGGRSAPNPHPGASNPDHCPAGHAHESALRDSGLWYFVRDGRICRLDLGASPPKTAERMNFPQI